MYCPYRLYRSKFMKLGAYADRVAEMERVMGEVAAGTATGIFSLFLFSFLFLFYSTFFNTLPRGHLGGARSSLFPCSEGSAHKMSSEGFFKQQGYWMWSRARRKPGGRPYISAPLCRL